MIESVKGLFKVNKNSNCVIFILQFCSNVLCDFHQSHSCWAGATKPKLIIVYQRMFFKKIIQFFNKKFLQNYYYYYYYYYVLA